MVESAGANALHLDSMDGRFVPNLTWGPKIVADLRKLSTLPFDCHLMIDEPERQVDEFRGHHCSLRATSHATVAPHLALIGARADRDQPQTPTSKVALITAIRSR